MNINWKQKLSSRKFWAAIVAVLSALCVIFGVDNLTMEQITGLIMSIGALIAYILGEGWVDAVRIKTSNTEQTAEKKDETNF